MSDTYISSIQDEDRVEISDLEPLDDGSSASFSFVMLKLARKVPLFASSRSRFTVLAWLTCLCLLLFAVQPALPDLPRQTSITSAHEIQFPPTIYGITSTHGSVTLVRISGGRIIVIQAAPGRSVWHHCKVQRWITPPRYGHPTIAVCP